MQPRTSFLFTQARREPNRLRDCREPPSCGRRPNLDQPLLSRAVDDRQRLSEALAQVASGSQAALEEVYSRTAAKLFGVCLHVLGDRGEAEDALQEVYLKVWRR